jgi:hypothetical protein
MSTNMPMHELIEKLNLENKEKVLVCKIADIIIKDIEQHIVEINVLAKLLGKDSKNTNNYITMALAALTAGWQGN